MRVEKLQLNGFKSFADRTVFTLHPGITCIVGPNGCGKSNVVDSFKWVLGEQSVKSLRGGKMEEVIFAGSQSKKPKGMAEVSLHISGLINSDNGKDQSSTISRRLYRSGDSDYLINKQNVRLKDIRDVFLDTGLEMKSYSILEQDRISAILASKPEDRRFLIEEVAGVVKYKVRRHEAINKLTNSRNNLARINDIVSEIKRQLNSLDRQARKAERYKKLMEELKAIELKIAKRDFNALNESLTSVMEQYNKAKEEDAAARAGMSKMESDIETRRIELAEDEKALLSLQSDLQEVQRQIADIERQIAVSETESEHLRGNIARLMEQQTDNSERVEATNVRKAELAATTEALKEEQSTLNSRMQERQAALKVHEDAIKGKEHNMDTRRRDSFRVTDELGARRNELHKYQASKESIARRVGELSAEAENLQKRLAEAERHGAEIQNRLKDLNGRLIIMLEEREIINRDITSERNSLEELRAATSQAREDLASSVSRLESLKEMDFAESTEEDLKSAIDILAAVSTIIEVPKEFERAVESALKETVNGFVLSGYGEIRSAIDIINQKDMGRTAFIPRDAQHASDRSSLPSGATAHALDIVKIKAGFEDVASCLLQNVVVVPDMETALSLRGAHPYTFVTVAGEIIEPSGAVIAGRSKGILALKRQIRETSQEIESRTSKVATLTRESEQVQKNLTTHEESLTVVAERILQVEKELSALKFESQKNQEEMDRAGRKHSQLKIEMGELRKEEQTLSEQIELKAVEIARLDEGITDIEKNLTAIQEEISSMREAYEEKRQQNVELQLSLNSCRERITAILAEERSVGALIDELNNKNVALAAEQEATELRIVELQKLATEKEETLKNLAIRSKGLDDTLQEGRSVMSGKSSTLRSIETDLRAARVLIDNTSHTLSELEVKKTEHTLKLENIQNIIRNNYDVALDTFEAEDATPEDEEELPLLKDKIERLGPVSLGSIEEYNELKERFDFLSQQQEDLSKSIAELEEAIARINATTRKKLRDAFEELKNTFAEVFVKLFGGGKAELILTDESNILETGIDIIAQPPGKRFQNITLLSGGEKTLTALALLFSGFIIKPTPLCILDEADAALDESNTIKFAELVKSLSKDVQFVIITHNRITMEAADHIYGVTMEDPGTSKIVSLELTDAEPLLE